MTKLFKCTVCNYIGQGDTAPAICPKCGQPHDKFVELASDAADKVYSSERTNDIHAEIITLTNKIIALSNEGIKINLDPACTAGFTKAVAESYVIKQRAKAEIENHIGKGKW